MDATVSPLGPAEQGWISEQLDAAKRFVADYGASRPLEWLAALDHAWASWMDSEADGKAEPNAVVNAVGVAFGQALVDALDGFSWAIATDAGITDLAVYGLPDTVDVLVYPANVVAKRYESSQKSFIQDVTAQMVSDIEQIRAGNQP